MKRPELNLFLLTNYCIPVPHESLFGNVKRLPKLFQWLVECRHPVVSYIILYDLNSHTNPLWSWLFEDYAI